MSAYDVEFSGKLMAGFDPREVRLHAANRLRMSEAQLDRVFDGRPIVLKKSVDAVMGQRYLGELHRLGMASRLVPLDQPPPAEPEETFKVVFLGEILPGFEADAVAVAAARRLNIGPVQVEKLFSGQKAVLKRGINLRRGRRYVAELAALGMRANLVSEAVAQTPAPQHASPPTTVLAGSANPVVQVAGAIPDLEGVQPELPSAALDAQMAALTTTQFDMPQNLLISGDVPDPMDEAIDHAATLLVDPARLVEQMSYEPPPRPQPVRVPLPTFAQVAESAVPYLKCPECAHSQPAGARCRRCGADLRPAPAAPPVTPDLQLEPLVEKPAAAEPEPPRGSIANATTDDSLAIAHAAQLQTPLSQPRDAGARKALVAGVVAAILLLFFLLR